MSEERKCRLATMARDGVSPGGTVVCDDCGAKMNPDGSGAFGFLFRCGKGPAPRAREGATLAECILAGLGHGMNK